MAEIQIIKIDPKTRIVSLELPNAPKRLTGIDLLIQIVALAYLRNPGRDVFDNQEGSGLRAEIGQFNLSSEASDEEFRMLAIQRTDKIQGEIISNQGTDISDPSEQLKRLEIIDLAFDAFENRGAIRVKIVNELGDNREIIV